MKWKRRRRNANEGEIGMMKENRGRVKRKNKRRRGDRRGRGGDGGHKASTS